MSGDQYPPDQVVTATVEAVNDRGAKLAGYGWCNFSKYGNVAPPEVGDVVEATLRPGKTGGHWIQGLRAAGSAPAGSDREFSLDGPEDDLDPATFGYQQEQRAFDRAATRFGGSGAAPRPVARPAAPAPAAPKATSRATLKAAALAAAAHFHSGRAGEEGAEGDVYETAYRFLAWLQEDEG